jgi:hypothetical protein
MATGKITAVTMSLSGTSVFANAYENWSADMAINSAAAVHACLQQLHLVVMLRMSPRGRRRR